MADLKILTLTGSALEPWLEQVAELRIRMYAPVVRYSTTATGTAGSALTSG